MQVSLGVPWDVTLDALSGRQALEDAFNKMPSLAVLKRSAAQVFFTDAKEPRHGHRQQHSFNCTGIRGLIRRPREKIRKTDQTRRQNRLQKGKAVKMEGQRRRDGRADEGSRSAPSGSGSGSGSGAPGAPGASWRRGTGTSAGAEKPKANIAATTNPACVVFLFDFSLSIVSKWK
ncbi:hypothetical protein F4677DRAFT_296397 [Hypoxylon crocopeplum]|nr:hypothetical protein F4677DRAFT_296397 [Hypoxylon crocopeplum]